MFFKNSCSSDGVGDGVGDGLCACKAVVVANINTIPKRHCDVLFLRILISPGGLFCHFPTTSTTNEPGLMLRCGLPPAVAAGLSVNSAALRKIFFVFGSKAIVRALACVLTAPASS